MVYRMYMRIDGGCRRNGANNPTAAAAVYTEFRNGKGRISTYCLEQYPKPTSQRAELYAVVLGLETALQQANRLHSNPEFEAIIFLDSKYALGCMTDWIIKWRQNNLQPPTVKQSAHPPIKKETNTHQTTGREVVNRDLISHASDLEQELKQAASIRYVWVPRSENQQADAAVNEALDRLEAYA